VGVKPVGSIPLTRGLLAAFSMHFAIYIMVSPK